MASEHDCKLNKAVVRRGQIIQGCESCLMGKVRPNELAAQNRRNYQREQFRRDTTQPFEKEYVKARGIEAAREAGWSDAAIRRFG